MNVRSRTSCLLAGGASSAALVLFLTWRAPVRADDKPAGDATTAVAAHQQLVGEWKLDAELSEDPLAKMRAAREEGGRSGGWGGGHGGGWGGGHGGGWGGGGGGWGGGGGHHGGHGGGYGGSSGSSGEGGGGARSMMLTATQITVTNIDPEVTILDPDGQIRRFHADDKGYKDDAGNEVKAKWDGDRLVVETKGERGSTKETWTVGADPRRLTVLLEIKRPYSGTVSVKRVFDSVPKS
jgi:hypothetical protein